MKFFLSFIIAAFFSFTTFGQAKMRSLEELINKKEPGWTLVKQWIDSAENKVQILAADTAKANDALYKTQVTTRSPMGAIVFMTGGLLIDNGWIRILGSGSEKLTRSLPYWNKGKTFKDFGDEISFLLIADDALGGFFLLNGGGLGDDLGKVYYWAPDNLEYEPLDLTYTEFLDFCFNSNLDEFYEGYRWKNWQSDLNKLKADEVFNYFPYLWTKEGNDINNVSRKAISVEEQYTLNIGFRKQLGLGKKE